MAYASVALTSLYMQINRSYQKNANYEYWFKMGAKFLQFYKPVNSHPKIQFCSFGPSF